MNPGSSPLARGLLGENTDLRLRQRIIPARAGFTGQRVASRRRSSDHPRSRGVYRILPDGEEMYDGSSPLARGLRDPHLGEERLDGIIPARAGFTWPRRPSMTPTAGSSPLARGLRCGHGRPACSPRIIPARAGFTRPRRPSMTPTAGSSPLARGLRCGHGRPACSPRIIPARAGFTRPTRSPRTRSGDHPRSRGVYRRPRPRSRGCAGSSPLARGLLGETAVPIDVLGIIPARAGFTSRRRGSRPRWWDHPRSRGVYGAAGTGALEAPGSSPLARGLPAGVLRNLPVSRIIPARAGFTAELMTASMSGRDHPRSRGVYTTSASCSIAPDGSSPLARGLPGRPPGGRRARWIIPARAGFTGGIEIPRSVNEDHPRSRGVYATFPSGRSASTGSSPLARGLRSGPGRGRRARRIIPARAGFTDTNSSGDSHATDHPRSRGVYVGEEYRDHGVGGSSPLARGLPLSASPWTRGTRIIPARAGFTSAGYGGVLSLGDHPRSRGVYSEITPSLSLRMGSSPLARGLQSQNSLDPERNRIIPARAGFTLTTRMSSLFPRDHPRSRGGLHCRCRNATSVWGIIPARAGFTVARPGNTRCKSDHPRSRGVYGHLGWELIPLPGSSPLARGLRPGPRLRGRGPGIIPARAGFT